MSDDERTVYVNNGKINPTEVYHAKVSHAAHRRFSKNRVDEMSVGEAEAKGLRPCKICTHDPGGAACPACGRVGDGDDVLADGQRWCGTDDCRVVSYHVGDDV